MGVHPNGWFIMENPNPKWMIYRGTPISGNLHIYICIYIYIHNVSSTVSNMFPILDLSHGYFEPPTVFGTE